MKRLVDNRSFALAEEIFNARLEASHSMLDERSLFVRRACPVCEYDSGKKRNVFGYEICVCARCLTPYLALCPLPAQLAKFYNHPLISKYNQLLWQRDRESEFKSKIDVIETLQLGRDVRVVELGSGPGQFVAYLRKQGYSSVVGVDVDKDACQAANKNGIDVRNIDIMQEKGPAADLYLLYEVIEHLFDPRTFLKRLFKQMPSGSALIITTPNADGADNALIPPNQPNRFIASAMFPPYHINAFSVKSFFYLALDLGFEILDISTPGSLDILMIEHHTTLFDSIDRASLNDHLKRIIQDILSHGKGSGHLQAIIKKPSLVS